MAPLKVAGGCCPDDGQGAKGQEPGAGGVSEALLRCHTEQVHEEILDEIRTRLRTEEGMTKVILRGQIVEHPFGTMKRAFNQGYLLLKGLRKVTGEIGLTMLAYDIRRAINILGAKRLIESIASIA